MNIRRIIKETVEDFDWIKDTGDLVHWESLRVGDEVELVYTKEDDPGYEFWSGTRGTVVKAGEFVSIDTMIDGKEERLLFDDSFDTEPNRRYMFRILNSLNESVEGVDPFKWIRDIEVATPDLFKGRVDDFIERFAGYWDGNEITFEPISDEYSSGVREIGRVYMDSDDGYSWYWDLLHDKNDDTYIVEIFEKPSGEYDYDVIDRERFETLNQSILYVFETMAEE